jgi:hypothetical protein
LDAPSRLDLYDVGRRYFLEHARAIDVDVVDVEGSSANLFVGSTAAMAEAVVRHLVDRLGALTLDGADTDDDVARYVLDRYQLPQKGAAAALVPVTFERPTAAAGAGAVAIGWRLKTLTGIEYVTLADAVFGSAGLSVTVPARASQAGQEFQVGANQVRKIEDLGTLWDKTLTVNNYDRASGGAPREDRDAYRNRARGFWPTAARGTLKAIEFGAKLVPGVDSASASEPTDYAGYPARVVLLDFADLSGVSNSSLGDAVGTELEDYRAGGIAVVRRIGVPQLVEVVLRLSFRAGVATEALSQQVRTAVYGFVNSLGTAQPLLRNDLGAVLARFRSSGLIPTQDSVLEPVGDLYPDAGKTIRVRLEDVRLA